MPSSILHFAMLSLVPSSPYLVPSLALQNRTSTDPKIPQLARYLRSSLLSARSSAPSRTGALALLHNADHLRSRAAPRDPSRDAVLAHVHWHEIIANAMRVVCIQTQLARRRCIRVCCAIKPMVLRCAASSRAVRKKSTDRPSRKKVNKNLAKKKLLSSARRTCFVCWFKLVFASSGRLFFLFRLELVEAASFRRCDGRRFWTARYGPSTTSSATSRLLIFRVSKFIISILFWDVGWLAVLTL